jgi:dihydrofolate reductase
MSSGLGSGLSYNTTTRCEPNNQPQEGTMGKVTVDITMSLDGYVAGPNQSRENPLGEGGEDLHEWLTATEGFQEMHGRTGGERTRDSEVQREAYENLGAFVMGRRMFGGGTGPWGSDPSFEDPWEGWWGDEPPFHAPVFVLTHHEREPLEKQGGTTFTFVTDGIEAALDQAQTATGGKDVLVAGGANAIQQYLKAGLIDELQVHVVPRLLGGGERLFDNLGADLPQVEIIRVVESPAVTHLKYRVVK